MTEDDRVRLAASLLDERTAEEIAAVYTDQVVFPAEVIIDRPGDRSLFPLWRGPVLVISHENQGVCTWGVSLDGPSAGAVLVGGDLQAGLGTVVYASDLAAFITARRWDARCLTGEPLLQAQADPVDDVSLSYLRDQFDERPATYGWPCPNNLRFFRDQLMVMLWAGDDQCDWWVSGSEDALRTLLPELRRLSNLAQTLWSNDDLGAALLEAE